jgi:hypothetical protein
MLFKVLEFKKIKNLVLSVHVACIKSSFRQKISLKPPSCSLLKGIGKVKSTYNDGKAIANRSNNADLLIYQLGAITIKRVKVTCQKSDK